VTDQPPAGRLVSGDGQPLASGREADVFALDERRVLRRYRTGKDVAAEAEVMAYVGGLGFPVPEVFEACGSDMVLERLDGPTMAQAALAGTVSLTECATVLANLLRRLHELPARSGAGTVVHLDLHPDNVLLSTRGPMVIDWANGRDGPGDLDSALTALILAQVAIGAIVHPLADHAGMLLDRFLEVAPGEPARMLDDAVALRRTQLSLSAEDMGVLNAAARVISRIN
jgi:tRNA A-37 threonylcarbamoyl transferase component Bud32